MKMEERWKRESSGGESERVPADIFKTARLSLRQRASPSVSRHEVELLALVCW